MMDILQTIWSAMSTPNESLVKIILILISYLDAFVGMLFFTTLLNIKSTAKRKLMYVLIYGTIGNLFILITPLSYIVFINIIIWPIIIFFVLKTTVIKSLLAEIITLLITSTLEFLFANVFLNLFNISS